MQVACWSLFINEVLWHKFDNFYGLNDNITNDWWEYIKVLLTTIMTTMVTLKTIRALQDLTFIVMVNNSYIVTFMEGKYEYNLRLRLDTLRRDKDTLGFFQRSFTRGCPADRGWTWMIPHNISIIILFTLPGSLHFIRSVIVPSLQHKARLASDTEHH